MKFSPGDKCVCCCDPPCGDNSDGFSCGFLMSDRWKIIEGNMYIQFGQGAISPQSTIEFLHNEDAVNGFCLNVSRINFSSSPRILINYVDEDNYISIVPISNTNLGIYEVVSGVSTLIDARNIPPFATDTLISYNGTNISIYYGNTSVSTTPRWACGVTVVEIPIPPLVSNRIMLDTRNITFGTRTFDKFILNKGENSCGLCSDCDDADFCFDGPALISIKGVFYLLDFEKIPGNNLPFPPDGIGFLCDFFDNPAYCKYIAEIPSSAETVFTHVVVMQCRTFNANPSLNQANMYIGLIDGSGLDPNEVAEKTYCFSAVAGSSCPITISLTPSFRPCDENPICPDGYCTSGVSNDCYPCCLDTGDVIIFGGVQNTFCPTLTDEQMEVRFFGGYWQEVGCEKCDTLIGSNTFILDRGLGDTSWEYDDTDINLKVWITKPASNLQVNFSFTNKFCPYSTKTANTTLGLGQTCSDIDDTFIDLLQWTDPSDPCDWSNASVFFTLL